MRIQEAAVVEEAEISFDHERLDVYCVARELTGQLAALLNRSVSKDVRERVERASTSILSNIAEGAAKISHPDKRRFYGVARGSAFETAAHLDYLCLRGWITQTQYTSTRRLLLRVVQMLTRLVIAESTR